MVGYFARNPLRAFARSRSKPVRQTVVPLARVPLWFHETLMWRLGRRSSTQDRLMPAIDRALAALHDLTDPALDDALRAPRIAAQTLLTPAGAPGFALVLEVMRRHLGFALRHNQIACALALLGGECVELRTGEGKTLAAALAAMVAARAGVSTHVITVNDYLARRDHDLMADMAARLGLTTAILLQDMPDAERLSAYDVDVVYGTNKTFVFDHLRDRREARTMPGTTPRQMGQAFGICDEADSVLVDDATVPMILSEIGVTLPAADVVLFQQLVDFVAGLDKTRALRRDGNGSWRLTVEGVSQLEREAPRWRHPLARSSELLVLAEQSLAARYGFRQGEAYVLRDGEIAMIDQTTGRMMPDRRWDYGLQQLVEITAGLTPSPETRTLGQITQQTYFRQYRILSGLTGTARECQAEFWAIYRLAVRPIAAHRPPQLRNHGLAVFADAAAKWQHIHDRALAIVAQRAGATAGGRAVLIGLNDVAEAHALAALFADHGRRVAVLDAMTEATEADLIAVAGQPGQITIATHLAGRGTDIGLHADVRAAGGLHVIIGSVMASARLERQLYGRAGRQGDPGSYERAISLTDRALQDGAMSLWRRLMTALLRAGIAPAFALARIQANRDSRARALRRMTMLREQDMMRQLGYK